RFLAYPYPSRTPSPTHPVVLGRPDFVEAAPTNPADPQSQLPPASPRRYDGEETKVSHPHPVHQRLVAHCSLATIQRQPRPPRHTPKRARPHQCVSPAPADPPFSSASAATRRAQPITPNAPKGSRPGRADRVGGCT